jgi:hypothetical protein
MNMQSQIHLQTLVSTTFSCITYLRNIFTEECFETIHIQNIPLKRIKKNQKTALLLSLLEKGIYETIKLKYLRSFTIGIYTNIDNPTTLVESYTFDIKYAEQDDKYFIHNIKKFCLVLQKLNPLPLKKYLTIKLVFTGDTPEEYQPYGFKDGNGIIYEYNEGDDIRFECEGSSGIVPSNIRVEHKLKDKVEDKIKDKIKDKKEDKIKDKKEDKIKDKKEDKIKDKKEDKIKDKKEDKVEYKVEYKVEDKIKDKIKDKKEDKIKDKIKDKKEDKVEDKIKDKKEDKVEDKVEYKVEDKIKDKKEDKVEDKIKDKKEDKVEYKVEYKVEDKKEDKIKDTNNNVIKDVNKIDSIRCTCLINANHFDMIYCDTCTNWLHTVCCGYFSNTDKRIPQSEYKCAFCYGEMDENLSEKSIIRRLLAVLYNEEYKGKESLANRMGINYNKLNRLFNRIAKEGFIKIHSRKKLLQFTVIKDEYTKSKLKKYFRVRKTSVPIEDIKSK